MDIVRRHRDRIVFLAAFLAPLALALVLVPFRGSFANTAAALLFVGIILAMAVAGNRLTGVIASVSSAIWFDFFLTKPYERLAMSNGHDIETTVCIVVVGVIVTELAARNRHHSEIANEESDYIAMVHDLADAAAGSETTSSVVRRASDSLTDLLELRACRFEAGTQGRRLPRMESDGRIVHAGLAWPVHDIGIPGPETEILVKWRGQAIGRFVLVPTRGLPVSMERRVVATLIADLVGAALSDRRRAA